MGGRVFSTRPLRSDQTIARVFGSTSETGGLAMSRSVGDAVLHRFGVISDPDLYERTLADDTIGLLLGSDGLTTSFGMARCFRCVLQGSSPQKGLRKLALRCREAMWMETDGSYVDDCSGVYVQVRSCTSRELGMDCVDVPLSPCIV